MLRASRVEVLLTATDLLEILVAHATGTAEISGVDLSNGVAVIRLKASVDMLPMPVSVELRLTVQSVEGTAVELGVAWTNMPLVPGFLKEKALEKAFEALPGRYQNGRFIVDAAEVLDEVPVEFRIEAVTITPDGVRLVLTDLAAFPFERAALLTIESPAIVPAPSTVVVALEEHEDYYEKLRANLRKWAGMKVPRWVQPLVPWVLAVPDFFVLMARLARDPRVPPMVKVIAGGVVVYFITPIDLIPDALPIVGQVDDVAVALFALEQMSTRIPSNVIQELWPGEGEVLQLVKEGTALFSRVLPGRMIESIRKLVSKRRVK